MKRSAIILLAGVLALAGCASHDTEFEAMLRLADRRGDVAEMQPYLHHPAREVQLRAIQLLGQMRDTLAVPMLLPFLESGSVAQRAETAFALGQLGGIMARTALLRHYPGEVETSVQLTIIEAIGKIGDASTLPFLRDLLGTQRRVLYDEAILALGRMAYRGLDVREATPALVDLLASNFAETRWRAAYTLMRSADTAAFDALRRVGAVDFDSRVRAQTARAFGRLGNPEALALLASLAGEDPDWRVRATAATSIGQLVLPGAADYRRSLPFTDSNEHVRLAALAALENGVRQNPTEAASDELQQLLTSYLTRGRDSKESFTWREQAAAATIFAITFPEQAPSLLLPLAEATNPFFRARICDALAKSGSVELLPAIRRQFDLGPAVVQVAVLNSLAHLRAAEQAAGLAMHALTLGDPVLTALAARFLAADTSRRQLYREPVADALLSLSIPFDVEAAAMLFEAIVALQATETVPILEQHLQVQDEVYSRTTAAALQQLTGRSYAGQIATHTEPAHDFSYQDIRELRRARAVLQTEKGEIVIDLFSGDAPLTVLNFVRLAESGFYDGLTFHRVVPNFVIQGGDPRGDSWGSPGYSIRSEFNRHKYLPGMVGMASAGPDTEGCQFFITHSVQPHLDGNYTIFGRVRRGMEVVNAIQVGDRIGTITIYR